MKPDPFLANATNALQHLRRRWETDLASRGEVHGQQDPFPQDHNFVESVSVTWTTRGHTYVLMARLEIAGQNISFGAECDRGQTALLKPTHPRECNEALADAVLDAFQRWVAECLDQ